MIASKDFDKINWPVDLSTSLIEQLAAIAQVKTELTTKELDDSGIAHQGISFILQGTATICMQTPQLKTVNNIVMGKGDWFGSYDIEEASYTPFFLTQIDKLTLIHFKNTHLQRIANNNIEIYKWFHALSFSAKAKWLQSQLIMTENILCRVAYLLIEIIAHQKQLQGELPKILLSQQQISRITGISRPRVNEAIKQLERNNLLYLARGCIYINDITGLGNQLNNIDLSIRDPRIYDSSL